MPRLTLRASVALTLLVISIGACGRCPQSIWGDLKPIQGDKVAPFAGYPETVEEASSRALAAVAQAVKKGARSWDGDPKGEERSYTWDLVAMTAALRGAASAQDAFKSALTELLRRELPGGAWPTLRIPDGGPGAQARPGHAVSAAALVLLADLQRDGLKFPGLKERLARGVTWLKATWQANGGLPLVPGSDRLSTEGTALATLAGLALLDQHTWCGERALAGARLLAGQLWRGDHFARGLVGEQQEIDADATGPHSHTALAVLALVRARKQLGESAPDPSSHDPLHWLLRHFSRTARVGGVTVKGLGGRLVVHDQAGMLYSCSGGTVTHVADTVGLSCPAGEVRGAEPIVCPSPFERCGATVASIPPGARPVPAVNAQVTLYGAILARALGHTTEATALLQAALAMQLPGGGIIAVAGPARSAPDSALRYPLNHRVVQYGSTALLALALSGQSPFSLLSPGGVPPLPLKATPPAAHSRKLQVQDLGLLPDPPSGWVASPGPDLLHLQAKSRTDGWVLWSTPPRGDLTTPAACWQLRMTVSGEGPWDTLQVKITDSTGLAYGLNLPGLLASKEQRLDLPLARLGLLWSRAGHAEGPFRPQRFHVGAVAMGTRGEPDKTVLLKARGLRLAPGDCLQGAPIRFRRAQVTPEGSNNRLPYLEEIVRKGKRALEVRYNVKEAGSWQRVVVQDKWNWSCVSALRLRYNAPQRTPIQIVLEDGQLKDGYSHGARFYAEGVLSQTDQWLELRVGINSMRPFDPKDLRLLDGRKLRKIALAFPSVRGAAGSGKVTLLSLEALADQDDLNESGSCK